MALESKFERSLVKELLAKYPGAVILKNNANLLQGFPDRLILYGPKWAAFEVKPHETARHRPNQDYWIDVLNEMSYANFVYPQNKEIFLHELQSTLRFGGTTRLSRRIKVSLD